MNREGNHKYDDIINLPHHTSTNHPQMEIIDRAAQFSPFAALTGYEDAVKEASRLTDRRIELDEYEKMALNERLQLLRERPENFKNIKITYFQPDVHKSGGSYLTVFSTVKKIDDFDKIIKLEDGTIIPIKEIIDIDADFFQNGSFL